LGIEPSFPIPVSEVVETISDICKHQNKWMEIPRILESALVRFDQTDYDNWNGGTWTWALRVEVPAPVYAQSESVLSSIEGEIGKKLKVIARQFPEHQVGEVTITPLPAGKRIGKRKPAEADVTHLWEEGKVRLFLSHLAVEKEKVQALKEALSLLGVGAFVAHTDIKPSLEWQTQIELGLGSMDALAALITPKFHGSDWTDQEVGWALGRGVPVINARLGKDPYGLAGKYQGIPGSLDDPWKLALTIVGALLHNSQTHDKMRASVAQALADSTGFRTSLDLCPIITGITDFTEEEKAVIHTACKENDQVYQAFKVTDKIYAAIGKPKKKKAVVDDDDVPF